MDMYIRSLDLVKADDFINPSTDRFGRVIRRETTYDHTVDLLINVNAVFIAESSIVITFPNNSVCTIACLPKYYHKIEVL